MVSDSPILLAELDYCDKKGTSIHPIISIATVKNQYYPGVIRVFLLFTTIGSLAVSICFLYLYATPEETDFWTIVYYAILGIGITIVSNYIIGAMSSIGNQ